jgi:signal transduction histidine kinase
MSGNQPIDSTIERPLAAGRRIVWIGFGSILLLMALTGFDVVRSLRNANLQNAALMKSFRSRDQVLDELRNIMIRSGTMIRDYLSESDETKIESGRADLEAARLQTEQLLEVYAGRDALLDPQQQKSLLDLKRGVEAYWKSLSSALEWDVATKKQNGEAYRRAAIGPLRNDVHRLSREITKLNEQELDAGEQLIQNEQSKLQTRLILAACVAVVIGCVLAFVVTIRNQRLEQAAEIQYRKVVRARQELRDLAARLETAQEEERKRLSRELHDEVGQSMSSMLVELSRLESVLPQDEVVRVRLASFRTQAETSVRSVRDMALLLRPSMLDDLGLVSALKWLGREAARQTGLNVRVDAEDTGDQLPDSHRTCIYRVVQEALNNCAKHAKAASVQVVLKQSPDALDVSVQDDGEGFEPSTEKGLGLLGMEERVTRLGGSIKVESSTGRGTLLSVHLPIPVLEKIS